MEFMKKTTAAVKQKIAMAISNAIMKIINGIWMAQQSLY
jgi:hypothetical protein